MCVPNAMELSLKGDTFTALKEDFDAILARTLKNMESKGADEATITLKLGISLEKTTDFSGEEAEEVTKPSFKHDISSVMQVKDKKTGALTGDYQLVWDEDEGKFVMKRIGDNQMTLFDVAEENEENVEYIPAADPVEPPMLEAADVADDDASEGDAIDTPFGWLSQFVGKDMAIGEAMGNYTVRTVANEDEESAVVLTSASTEDSVFHCDAEILKDHIGHELICVGEQNEAGGPIVKIVVKCLQCDEDLYTLYNPILLEESVTDGSTGEDEEGDEELLDDAELVEPEFVDDKGDEVTEYAYEEPEEEE